MSFVKRLVHFETSDETVASFNELFPECTLVGFSGNSIVTIGEPCTPETVRMINLEGTEFRHDFKPIRGAYECN